ncbi:SDR family oxidoreductase [Actinomadura sp. HBU206391]|uniref:SDR family oxidoreductase n=1 Tax=Actinomadura sp. HBU206391 TaxID=2731692 RepID=UPI002905905C|nr:SDR family oxidoreductase [Actinomadura sp. HBU206391]
MAISYDYGGRTVLVTGGTKGIGAGVASAFLAAGADVVVCARRPPDRPPSAGGRAAWFVQADVRDAHQVESLIDAVAERYGRLDAVVNNAGGSPYVPAADASPGFHAKVIELNLVAPLHVSQRAHQVMRTQDDGGAIVMVGSVSGVRPSPGTAAYGAAKAGLHHLAACLAAEWAPKVRVNSVVVGLADTGAAGEHYGGAGTLAQVGATVPARRLAEPADVAAACLFLGAPEAAYITGSTLTVDGGGERPAWSHVVAEAVAHKTARTASPP